MAEVVRARVAFEGAFTQVPNTWVRDRRLSRRARGLMVELFSHSVGWRVTERDLLEAGPEGRDALRTALRELEDHGYLEREQGRGEGGHFEGSVWRTCDPFTVDGLSGDGSPDDGESAAYIRTPSSKNTKVKNECSSGDERATVTEAFEEFWAVYPRRVGKAAARRSFERVLRRVGASAVIEGARRLRDDPNLPEPQFVPHPTTWLNRDGWEDEPLPVRVRGGFGGALAAAAEADAWFAAEEDEGPDALEAGGLR